MRLDQYMNDEGLIPTSSLNWDGECFRLVGTGEKVWVSSLTESIVDILMRREDLWRIAQIRVQPQDMIQSRLRWWGIPFNLALTQLLSPRKNQSIIKSMYKRIDADDIESDRSGIVATMVTHLTSYRGVGGLEVQLEAWQIPNIEAETFYLHSIFTVEKRCFVHLDGATMYHNKDSKDQIIHEGIKARGYDKQKHFRLDGEIHINDVCELGVAFLPLDDLATEYLITQEVVDLA